MEAHEKYFNDNYEVLQYYEMKSGNKVYLGEKSDKKCRFCGQKEPETSFYKIAHALPELVGNRSLFANYECDNCNEKFSKSLEDNFAKFINPYRTFGTIRGKTGVPSYKTKQKKSRVDYNDGQLFITNYLDDDIIELDHENSEIIVKTPQQPYCPLSVFKCLAKMAISIMPSSFIDDFTPTIAWINDVEHQIKEFNFGPMLCFTSFTPGHMPIENPFVYLFKRKQNDRPVPYMQFVMGFGNVVFQLFLPYAKPEVGKIFPVTMNHFPVKFGEPEKYGRTMYGRLDLTSKEIKRDTGFGVSIGYTERVRKK